MAGGAKNNWRTKMAKKESKVEQTPQEPTDADLFAEETREAKSLADIAGTGGGGMDGELVSMEALADVDLLVTDFRILPSNFREGGTYVMFQAKTRKDDKLVVCRTNAMVPMKAFAAIDKADLPSKANFFMQERQGGKPYWNIQGWQHPPED